MSKRDIRVILKFLILPAFTIIFATCSITREDMYKLASTPSLPDIEVMGYQNEIGFYDFGSVDLYTTSFASFIIKNNGSGGLMIKGISFMEEDIEWFTIDTSTLSSIVSSGESTVFMIKFKPTMLMTRSVTVVISTNCLDKNPYTFVVKGTGSGVPVSIPDINVRQGIGEISIGTLIDFGNVQIGNNSSKVFTIENKDTGELSVLDISLAPGGGTNLGEFSIIAPSIPISLAQNEHTEFTVIFNPQSIGIKSATLSIANDDPDESPYTFGVQGNGVEVPQADINVKQGETDIPDGFGSYYFGYVQCDSFSRPTNFTIENTGTAPLNITSVTLTAGDTNQFSIDTSGMVFTLDPCGETVFTVKFLPLLPEGYKWATVTIVNNDPDENPYTFTVEGEGFITAVPDINVLEAAYDSDHDFGPVLLGSSKTEIFTIENTG
ncbi:MAG: choice-of-anchor D domain-containing protein, partial [Spirochaetota bacterium]